MKFIKITHLDTDNKQATSLVNLDHIVCIDFPDHSSPNYWVQLSSISDDDGRLKTEALELEPGYGEALIAHLRNMTM